MLSFLKNTTKVLSIHQRSLYTSIFAMVKTKKAKIAPAIVSPIKNIQIEDPSWFKFSATTEELTLDNTLPSGQVFRWKKLTDSNNQAVWRGVIRDRVFTFVQLTDQIKYNVAPELPEKESVELLNDYFQMKHKLVDLYKTWSTSTTVKEEPEKSAKKSKSTSDINAEFKWAGSRIKGLRLIRQNPHECLFSFICSQNNNVARISQMVEKLCAKYGTLITTLDEVSYYKFPELKQLEKATEDELKELGFGYRARYIVASVKQVKEKGDDWLMNLRQKPRDDACQELTTLTGVGKKVADCTALFSLDKLDLVPVDTHVWQIAQRFMPKLGKKSLTPQIYTEVGDFFREKFGDLAGWAHSILFAAELSSFKKALDGSDADTNTNVKEENNNNNNIKVIEGVLDEVAESNELNSARRNLKRKFDEVDKE